MLKEIPKFPALLGRQIPASCMTLDFVVTVTYSLNKISVIQAVFF